MRHAVAAAARVSTTSAVPFRATGFRVCWAAEAAMGLQPATVAFEANKMAEWLTLMSPCRIPA